MLMRTILFIICELVFISILSAKGIANGGVANECITISNPDSAGFFSYYLTVLGALDKYEEGKYCGVKVDFGQTGWYYDKNKGDNWWEYYFQPIELGESSNCAQRALSGFECAVTSCHGRDDLDRIHAKNLINNYIKIKDEITAEANSFANQHFKNFVIGVHFRGTDKFGIGESEVVSYYQMLNYLIQFIIKARLKKFEIFIATDEANFIRFMEECFPGKILYQQAIRSENMEPVHVKSDSPYQVGKEALLDALLLSKCNYLIRTVSNLSLCSTFFNPYMNVEVVNSNYCTYTPEK